METFLRRVKKGNLSAWHLLDPYINKHTYKATQLCSDECLSHEIWTRFHFLNVLITVS